MKEQHQHYPDERATTASPAGLEESDGEAAKMPRPLRLSRTERRRIEAALRQLLSRE